MRIAVCLTSSSRSDECCQEVGLACFGVLWELPYKSCCPSEQPRTWLIPYCEICSCWVSLAALEWERALSQKCFTDTVSRYSMPTRSLLYTACLQLLQSSLLDRCKTAYKVFVTFRQCISFMGRVVLPFLSLKRHFLAPPTTQVQRWTS